MELHRRLGDAEAAGDLLVRELLANGLEDPLLRPREGVPGPDPEPGDALDPLGEDGARRPERPLADAADRVPQLRGPGRVRRGFPSRRPSGRGTSSARSPRGRRRRSSRRGADARSRSMRVAGEPGSSPRSTRTNSGSGRRVRVLRRHVETLGREKRRRGSRASTGRSRGGGAATRPRRITRGSRQRRDARPPSLPVDRDPGSALRSSARTRPSHVSAEARRPGRMRDVTVSPVTVTPISSDRPADRREERRAMTRGVRAPTGNPDDSFASRRTHRRPTRFISRDL